MGNRAVVSFNNQFAVYLYWNGGIESVTAFIDYMKARDVEFSTMRHEQGYTAARFIQIVGNFFKGTLSLGITNDLTGEDSDTDNGVYLIDAKGEIKNRTKKELKEARASDSYKELMLELERINDPFFTRG